ncbi:hypothetical protein CC117_33580 [Parafrankia colletiae]|uniref:Uncharacterized protein n=1 Tax=Parafrankia colletiae TaxID=573497 RepID=A0A1S1R6N8_9ACTN|nr:hypothetical protein CC117_33580 [Parafrankia colletiae]
MIMTGGVASPGALDTICWIRSRLDRHSVNSGEVDLAASDGEVVDLLRLLDLDVAGRLGGAVL